MADYRTMYDCKWIRAWDLNGQDVVVTIERVEAGIIENEKEKTSTRIPVLWFKGWSKPFGVSAKINGKTIAGMYGKKTESWKGKQITLYPTTTELKGEVVDCIRIRPEVPTAAEEPADLLADRPGEPLRKKAS